MLFCVKTPISKLYVFGLALLLAVTLAGCGGGSGGGADTTDPSGTTPDSALQMAAEAAEAASMAAATAAGNTSDHAAAAAEKMKADAAAAAAATAAAAAQTAADAGDLATAQAEQAKAEAAKADAEAAMAAAAMLASDAMAAEMMAGVAAKTKAAGTKEKAIGAEAAQTGAGHGLGGSGVTTYSLEIERDRDGTTVTINDSAMEDEDDPKFAKAADLPDSNGFGGSMHVRAMPENDDGETVTEIVIVRTDIAAPKATAFAKVAGQALDVSTNTQNDTPTVTNEALEIPTRDFAPVASDSFSAGGAAELTFDRDDSNTTDKDEAFETAGTYNGAPGMYRCDASGVDCTVTLDAKGKVTAVSGGWIFTPDKGATSDVLDANFLRYGFWLKNTEKDGATTYNEVETFADAVGHTAYPDSNTGMQNAVGSATYEGGAAGVYVKNVFDSEGEIDTATSGHFTADVSLTATFGGSNAASNQQFTIGGGITNFGLSDDDGDPGWGVNLKLADFSGRGAGDEPGKSEPGNNYANSFSGDAEGGGATGSWSGMFYGSGGETTADDDGSATNHPVAVAGEFNANFSNGAVAGAYGANKK